ncbi:MAG: bifunctional lysylphosphatidylglycerol flippase/synthetase MprF [Gammaproteobacteria bacterium]|nr:bifunctional lysylphosphatidylglycerol flippase/synthetase MprF [Gammaproteobacteria bacterium]
MRISHVAAVALGLLIFAGASVLMYHELAGVHPRAVLAAVTDHSAGAVALALVLTLVSYLAISGYDALALRYVGRPLPYAAVAPVSLLASAVGQTVGFAVVSGGAIRYRMLSALGLGPAEIAREIACVAVTFGVGVVAVASGVFLLEPARVGILLGVATPAVIGAGVTLAIPVLAGFALGRGRPRELAWRRRRFTLPSRGMLATQLALAALDLAAAAGVLYVLMPDGAGLGYGVVLGVFVVAVIAAIASHVPGGLGVFEGVVVLAFPDLPRDRLLGAVLAYRAIYYLLPFALAALAIGLREGLRLRARLPAGALRRTRDVVTSAAPLVLTAAVFVAGIMLVFSGAVPAFDRHEAALLRYLPLPLVEISHLAGSLLGVGLMVLARGLQRRSAAAYHLAFLALALGIAVSLVKGIDWQEAVVLGVVLAVLGASRGEFHRTARIALGDPGPRWLLAIAVILACGAWLTLFAYRHVEYATDLWWQFELDGHAPRSLRAMLAAALALTAMAALRLFHPPAPRAVTASAAELGRVRPLVAASPEPAAALALLGDKGFLFDDADRAFLMYQVRGRTWVAMGGPLGGAPDDELAWRFLELAEHHGGRPAFYQVAAEDLHVYVDMGLDTYKLGEEAIVPLDDFSLTGKARAGLRQAHRRAARAGAGFTVVAASAVPALLGELAAVSDAWLAAKHTREKGFALGRFEPRYLAEFPCAVVRVADRVVAFANLWQGGDGGELSIDLMRHAADAPKGIMDYLFVELMLWGAAHGYRRFNLGMAPLSGLEIHPLAPRWHRFGATVYRHGEYFYNFEGLRAYKEKFDPRWRPRYLATRGGAALPATLLDISALIAGSLGGIVRH